MRVDTTAYGPAHAHQLPAETLLAPEGQLAAAQTVPGTQRALWKLWTSLCPSGDDERKEREQEGGIAEIIDMRHMRVPMCSRMLPKLVVVISSPHVHMSHHGVHRN